MTAAVLAMITLAAVLIATANYRRRSTRIHHLRNQVDDLVVHRNSLAAQLTTQRRAVDREARAHRHTALQRDAYLEAWRAETRDRRRLTAQVAQLQGELRRVLAAAAVTDEERTFLVLTAGLHHPED